MITSVMSWSELAMNKCHISSISLSTPLDHIMRNVSKILSILKEQKNDFNEKSFC